MRTRIVSALVAVLVASFTTNTVTAGVEGRIASAKQLRAMVINTAVVELPAKAAKIVSETPEDLREKAAVRVVRTFLQGRHSLAPSLIGAIAKASPEVSHVIVAEAVMLFPESAYSIARAATTAAPEYSFAIALRAAASSPSKNTTEQLALGAASADNRLPQIFAVLSSELANYSAEEGLRIATRLGRIGASPIPTPIPVANQSPLPGATVQVVIINNVPVVNIIPDPIQIPTLTIPDDLTGVEQKGQIDVIARVLDQQAPFFSGVVAAPKIYIR